MYITTPPPLGMNVLAMQTVIGTKGSCHHDVENMVLSSFDVLMVTCYEVDT
jgi:hypothetical protein